MFYKSISYTVAKIIFVVFLASSPAVAGENEEIDFLLMLVSDSTCTFIRNGREYQGWEALEHLEKKFNYAKSHINNAEDFIIKIASRSSISKKPYQIECQGKKILTGEWMTEALNQHRIRAAH